MDLDVLITAGIGVLTTFCSGFFTWIFSKKKYNTEVDSNVISNLQDSIKVYETMVKDLQRRLDFYVKLAEENRVEMYRVKNMMFQMLNKACIDGTCPKRQLYSEEEIREIIGLTENKTPISYEVDFKED